MTLRADTAATETAFDRLPPAAAWRHQHARDGFEVAYFTLVADGYRVRGSTVAVEDGRPWTVSYDIALDDSWRTRRAILSSDTLAGTATADVAHDGSGAWRVDGVPAPQLAGCLDLDLESSAMTNAFPVHRLRLAPKGRADAPAAYVRALDLGVARLDQTYERLTADTEASGMNFHYTAPAFAFSCELRYDRQGLVRTYPGIATRVL